MHCQEVPRRSNVIDKSCFLFNELIGEGGFGKVYSAVLVRNRNWLAVKEINKFELLQHKTGLSMLTNELAALQRLEHPFVIRLHFAFQDRVNCYLAFDMKTGGDLRHYLKRKLIFEEHDVAFYVACLSSALDYIHSKNVIHRDVKPENVILDNRGYPHLADFGVAHVQESFENEKTLTSHLASGTKQYLAPEVFTKSHVHGPEADFWSLGVLAYELLFGRRPFERHCPTPFITFLENALTVSRRQQLRRERIHRLVARAQQRQQLQLQTNAGRECHSPKELSENGSNSLSPVSSAQASPVDVTSIRTAASPMSNGPPVVGCEWAEQEDKTVRKGNCKIQTVRFQEPSSLSESEVSLAEESWGEFPVDESPAVSTPAPSEPAKAVMLNGFLLRVAESDTRLNPRLRPEVSSSGKATNRTDSGQNLLNEEDEDDPKDHWLFTPGGLPSHLRVSIPTFNMWLGAVSPACIDCISGLLEIRPPLRLGARNSKLLYQHEWLRDWGVADRRSILTREVLPHFCPGRRSSIAAQDMNPLCILGGGAHRLEEIYSNQNPSEFISVQQQLLFKDFAFISNRYTCSFRNAHINVDTFRPDSDVVAAAASFNSTLSSTSSVFQNAAVEDPSLSGSRPAAKLVGGRKIRLDPVSMNNFGVDKKSVKPATGAPIAPLPAMPKVVRVEAIHNSSTRHGINLLPNIS